MIALDALPMPAFELDAAGVVLAHNALAAGLVLTRELFAVRDGVLTCVASNLPQPAFLEALASALSEMVAPRRLRVLRGVEIVVSPLPPASALVLVLDPWSRPRDPLSRLTAREAQVAEYLIAGATLSEAANALEISPETAKTHAKKIYEKLGVSSRVELARVVDSGPSD